MELVLTENVDSSLRNVFSNHISAVSEQPSVSEWSYFFNFRSLHNVRRTTGMFCRARLPTAAARVRARGSSCGIYGGQSGTRVGFLRVFRFPLPIFSPPNAP
jgi:hypothetical protein